MISLPHLLTRVQQHDAKGFPGEGLMKQAAVAAILRAGTGESPELLFIRRAENPRDHWSGHMAFPGGRVDPVDTSAHAAAVRETIEEVGLDLRTTARHVGKLSTVLAKAHGKPLPMVVFPFVYVLESEPTFQLNHEVQETVWVPFSFFLRPENRAALSRPIAGIPFDLPCYRYEGRVIWGLTLKMVDELRELVTR